MKDRAPRGFNVYLHAIERIIDSFGLAIRRLAECRAAGICPSTPADDDLMSRLATHHEWAVDSHQWLSGARHDKAGETRNPHTTPDDDQVILGYLADDVQQPILLAFARVMGREHNKHNVQAAAAIIVAQVYRTMRLFERPVAMHRFDQYVDIGHLDREAITAKRRRRAIPTSTRDAAMERCGNRCVSCGSAEDLALDHIFPFSKGGPDEDENFQILCRSCNSSKRDRVQTADAGE